MRKVVFGTGLLIALAAIFAFAQPATQVKANQEAKINWLTWEEAMVAMENNPKKMFIDVYTDWCGWCKRMDASTFTDSDVIEFMNENFYAVKFNAESTVDQQYKGNTLSYREGTGRRGVHELAVVLLNRRLGYPSFVYLDEEQNSLKISPGYKTPDVLLVELKAMATAN